MTTNEYTSDRRFTKPTVCEQCGRNVGPYLHSTPQVNGQPGPRVCRECYAELGHADGSAVVVSADPAERPLANVQVGDEVSLWNTDCQRGFFDMKRFINRVVVSHATEKTITISSGLKFRRFDGTCLAYSKNGRRGSSWWIAIPNAEMEKSDAKHKAK